jgi:hypothetical protein
MKTCVAGLAMREAEQLLEWRNSWEQGDFDCYKSLGVQVFAAMLDDATFRKLVIRKLQLPKPLRGTRGRVS